MKNLKKFGSAFLAGTMLLSSFAVSAYAQDSTDDIKYLINDDFSDFELVYTGEKINGKWVNNEKNNGIDHWRIEGNNNLSEVDTYVTKANLVDGSENILMTDALRLGRMNGNNISGARVWEDNIGAGDTLNIEYKIWVGSNAEFGIGLVDDNRETMYYENDPNAFLFYVLENQENLWMGKYNHNSVIGNAGSDREWKNITFKKNEVNDVKIEITMNDDVSDNTANDSSKFDTIKMTVKNSAGITTDTMTHNFRKDNKAGYVPTVDSIKGVSIYSRRTTDANYTDEEHAVYLDDFKVYKSQPSNEKTIFEDDFSTGYGKWETNTNNTLTEDWFTTKDYTDSTTGDVILDKAMYIGSNTTFARLYKIFDDKETIGAGESFTIEFDMIADNDVQASLHLIAADQETGLSSTYSRLMFIYNEAQAKNAVKSVNQVFSAVTQKVTDASFSSIYSGLNFTRNEKNHIKIDYTFNSNLSADTKDSITMTITNSAGTTQATREANFRSSSETEPKLNGVKGILFNKHIDNKIGNPGEMYIDNLVVTKNVTVPTAEITADLNAGGNSSATITFSEEMTADGVKDIFVKDNFGNRVALGEGTFDATGKIYTLPITGTLTAGERYIVVVPATVTDKLGNRMQASTSKSFSAKSATNNFTVVKRKISGVTSDLIKTEVLRISAATDNDYADKTINVLVAGYDANGKLISVSKDSFKGADGYSASKSYVEGTTYKAFLWDAQSGKPLCAEAK